MEHVSGAADKFQFPPDGSEFVNLKDVSAAIESCFATPFCRSERSWLNAELDLPSASSSAGLADDGGVRICHDGFGEVISMKPSRPHSGDDAIRTSDETDFEAHAVPNQGAVQENSFTNPKWESETLSVGFHEEPSQGISDTADRRKIVLVGQDLDTDIRYLRQIGIDLNLVALKAESGPQAALEPMAPSSKHRTLDTHSLWRAYAHEWDPKSLGSLLQTFGLVGWHLHNAGNDAVYTLWAMIAVVLQHTVERGDETAKKRREEKQRQLEFEAIMRAGVQARQRGEAWNCEAEYDSV